MATGLRARRGALAWLIAGALALAACGPGAGERAQEHRRKGTALLREGQYAAAVGELQKAVELDRDSAEAHTELGNAYRGLKQYDKAFEAYRAAKKVDRYVTRPHIENARALIEAGQLDAAVDELNHVIELDPKNLEAMLLLSRVSLTPRPLPGGGTGVPRASLERAELNLESAAQLAPDHLEVHHLLAQAREQGGQRDKAREAWGKVRALAAARPDQATLAAEAAAAVDRLR